MRSLPIHCYESVGCSLIEEAKKRRKNYSPKNMGKSRILGAETPELTAQDFAILAHCRASV